MATYTKSDLANPPLTDKDMLRQRAVLVVQMVESGMTFKAVGQELNITGVRVRQIFRKAKRLPPHYMTRVSHGTGSHD